MKEIPIKDYVRYLFGISFLLFVLNKLFLRSWVLKNQFPEIFQIIVLSIPNLLEAIMGTLVLTAILMQFRQIFKDRLGAINDNHISLLAVVLAAIYVITQELKYHNLGGNNVYDHFDLVASIIGLIGTYVIIQARGFIHKQENQ